MVLEEDGTKVAFSFLILVYTCNFYWAKALDLDLDLESLIVV